MNLIWTRCDRRMGRRFTVKYDVGSPAYSVHHYANQGPGRDVDVFYVFRDAQSRGVEVHTESEVESLVFAWTAQDMRWPRWDVYVYGNRERSGRPVWIDSYWREDKAQSAVRKINAGPALNWARVRRVPWTEWAQEAQAVRPTAA